MTTSIGMNLAAVSYWGTSYPFIDRMKTSGAWVAQGGDAAVPLDKDGYPTAMPAGATTIYAMAAVDPAALAMPDRYVLTWTGDASFRLGTDTSIVSQEDGRIVFDYSGDTGRLQVSLTAIDVRDPIGEIHLVRADQEGAFRSGATFNPAFLEKASQWETLRFMDWGATNDSDLVRWADRPQVGDMSWAANQGGVPLEIMVRLANEAGTDMWYNVPAEANDDFVARALSYVRDNLAPGLKLHLEYSNEVWNWTFDQSQYALAQGDRLWGKDADGDGRIDPKDPAEHVSDGWLRYYGYRSAQIAKISDDVFGAEADARVANVIATQTAVSGREKPIFTGVELAGHGTVARLFDEYAVTTYFGNAISNAGSDPAKAAIVLGWAKTGAIGKTRAFEQLEHGGLVGDTSLDSLKEKLAYQAGVATANGLKLVSYEGGTHLLSSGFPDAVQPTINAFFKALMDDPRMGDLYARMVADFQEVGGAQLNAFNDAGPIGKSGVWGALESTYDEGSMRYDALVAADRLFDGGPAPPRPGLIAGTAAPDSLTGTAAADRIEGRGGDDSLLGAGGSDTLDGGDGDDTLDGGAGADRLAGGAGGDRYLVDNAGDDILETGGGGYDTVDARIDYVLPENVEKLELSGPALNGTGNDGRNTLIGTAAGNLLDGRDGADTLFGLGGNDTLRGGAGNDTLVGGRGADILTGGSGADVFRFRLTELGGSTADDDHVTDFSRAQGDRLDFSQVDAIEATGRDEAFRFIGTAAFGRSAGELRVSAVGTDQYVVTGDVDGDGRADFSLTVKSATMLAASDFIL